MPEYWTKVRFFATDDEAAQQTALELDEAIDAWPDCGNGTRPTVDCFNVRKTDGGAE